MPFNNSSDHVTTQYNVITGGANNTLNNVAPSSTVGIPLISQNATTQPVFGTAVVAGGGTGAVTLTGVLTGNGTSPVTANAVTNHGVVVGAASNAVATVAVGATGTVLAGNTGADPAFTATPALTSVTLGGGTALGNYLQGTYVPVVDGQTTGPTVTYTTQIGKYTRIGNMVFVTVTIQLATYSGGSGNLLISLPSGLSTNATYDCTGSLYVANLTFSGQITLRFPSSFGFMQIATSTTAGASGILQVSALSATTLIKASGVYFV